MTSNHFWAVSLLSVIAFSTFASAQNDLVISEYVEGSSFNKAIELCNPAATSVNLATESYVLQVYSNGASTATSITLTGSVPSGGSFVVTHPSFSLVGVTAGQTSSSLDFNGNDVVVLRKGGGTGAVVDSFGQIGISAGSPPPNFAVDTTYRKKSCGLRDTNTDDVFNPLDQYDLFVIDTASGLNSCPSSCVSGVAPTPTLAPTASPTTVPVVVSTHNDSLLRVSL